MTNSNIEMNTNPFADAVLSFGKEAGKAAGKHHPAAGFALEIWQAADAIYKAGEEVNVPAAMAKLDPAVHKISNVTVELSGWRKYHGLANSRA